MNKLYFLLLTMSTLCVHSKSWNEVFSESSNLRFDQQAPMLINDKIVFKTKTEGAFGLWSYDLETNQKSSLIPPDVDYELNDVVQLGDAVYFLLKRLTAQPYFQLWKTEGDLYNSRKVSDLEFRTDASKPSLVVYGNTLFARGDNGAILEIQNDQIINYQVQIYEPDFINMCVFNEQDFILIDKYSSDRVVRITGGVLTDITAVFADGFKILSAVKVNNECYFNSSIYDNGTFSKNILKISQAGEITSFRESVSLARYYSIFNHNNNKYVFRDDPTDRTSTIVQLAEDDNLELNVFKLKGVAAPNSISTKSLLFFQDYIQDFASNTYNSTQYLLNDNLELINKTTVPLDTGKPRVQQLLNSDTLVFKNEHLLGEFSLKEISSDGSLSELNSLGFEFLNVVSSDTNDTPYFVLKNKETGVKSIFSLNDKPKVGTSLNGIWHDPNLKNQGLFIKQGKRNGSSTYVSVTMYTYKDGQPFWIAGNADYSLGQQSIEIDLFDFQGAEFLELIDGPKRNSFGKANITPLGCNTIQLQLTNEGAVSEFIFSRINNITYEKYCLESTD